MKLENLNIIIADDHPLFRNALRLALSNAFEKTQWFEADSAEALQGVLDQKETPFDLILLDLQMPGSHGYSTLIHLRTHYPDIPVVVISAHEDINTISRAIHYGSSGFIPKSASMEVLAEALNAVLYGDIWLPKGTQIVPVSDDPTDKMANRLSDLTPQQYRVLQMFAEGLLNKQIAYDFGVSEATIKAHATAIFRKLGVRNRTQAVIALQQLEMDRIDIS
ncbi:MULTISPECIES: response regulator transcription factor [Shewanella]|jgi:DNA-binding NarL/FixJ family response regulator|uniref:Two component transcriptional regulator, LuxR family n=3 Tax=Shewanella TaxID=22 RepID=Q081B4_SHEFN|nr:MULTISPECIES: response regulator transcription factor [Shewanella]MBB1383358.1 response regulator transcription factor [Shewanella sp. SR41-2]ABI72151.1 two component transcriptional regulator, LuxR family [Shewanella frigidimarina NCIMB 400]KVX03340.1 LuxR family transcriptional regulator [Shewanella frigidimarina]PKI03021.1 DNA-binding response regulator [Shewanella sp. 11B5]RPA34065.1 DNA-binding response regulator [Shewanella frigidimarina]|tara:strand:+ start:7142 stop:7804 length:663 start_codon:yes stop_codon:yes gene_type:complete